MKIVYAHNGSFYTSEGQPIQLFDTVVYPNDSAPYDATCDSAGEIVRIETAPKDFALKEGSVSIPLPRPQ